MEKPEEIRARARQRALERKLSYAGALTPREAYELWQQVPGTSLVDVRTKAEWDYVGRVPGAVEIEWNHYPSGRNPAFAAELQAVIERHDAPVLFLCRSGGRSNSAAALAAELDYSQAFNILEGFEGDVDPNGHRNQVGGWRRAKLPWRQS